MVVILRVEIGWVVELVNEYAFASRVAAAEQAQPYPEPSLLPDGWPEEVDVAQLVPLANELHRVFVAADRSQPAAPALNKILNRTRPWPQAGEAGTVWSVEKGDSEPLAAAAALALLQFLQERGQQRLGLCAAVRCADVYADSSPAGRRRFCSITCLNRNKVAAHRTRKRSTRL